MAAGPGVQGRRRGGIRGTSLSELPAGPRGLPCPAPIPGPSHPESPRLLASALGCPPKIKQVRQAPPPTPPLLGNFRAKLLQGPERQLRARGGSSAAPGEPQERGARAASPTPRPSPPRPPRPHLGSPRLPLPRRAAAGLPHVTREQLRPESPGPARGGPSPPPSGSHVAPRPAGQRPRPPREGSDGRALQAPWGPHGAPTSVPARGRTAGPSAAWFPLALGAAEEAGEGRKRGRWVAGSCPRSRRRVASSATSGIEPLPPAPAPALSLQREPWAAWDWVGQNKHVQGVSQILKMPPRSPGGHRLEEPVREGRPWGRLAPHPPRASKEGPRRQGMRPPTPNTGRSARTGDPAWGGEKRAGHCRARFRRTTRLRAGVRDSRGRRALRPSRHPAAAPLSSAQASRAANPRGGGLPAAPDPPRSGAGPGPHLPRASQNLGGGGPGGCRGNAALGVGGLPGLESSCQGDQAVGGAPRRSSLD
nr:uncharacterized protein LOC127487381 [Oryctolagus cuniculus]